MSGKKEAPATKKKWEKVSIRHTAEIAALHQKANVKTKELYDMYPQYSPRSIRRHAVKAFNEETHDRRKFNKGIPKLLTLRDKRIILRNIPKLRRREGNFTSKRLATVSGVVDKVKPKIFKAFLNDNGYKYLATRKKGLLKPKDLKTRKEFCRRILRRQLGLKLRTKGISMYVDGKGFAWKQSPKDQATAPKSKVWR